MVLKDLVLLPLLVRIINGVRPAYELIGPQTLLISGHFWVSRRYENGSLSV